MRRPDGGSALTRMPPELVVTLLGLGAFTAFMLVRPLFSDGAYFRPRLGVGTSYNWLLLPLFVPYALTLRAIHRGRPVSLKAILIGAAVVALPLVVAPLQLSQDLYEYLFYAKMHLVHGANPYLLAPHSFGWDPWYPYARWPGSLSTYGPVWLLVTEGAVAASAGHLTAALLLAKGIAFGLGAATVWGLVLAVADERVEAQRASFAVAAFALNPLVVSTVGLSGHADAALACCFAWAVWADRRRHAPWLATLLLTLATLVKAYAAPVLLVYLIARWRARGPAHALRLAGASAALASMAFAPFWAGWRTFAGMIATSRLTSSSLAGAMQAVVARVLGAVDVERAVAAARIAIRWGGVLAIAATIGVLAASRRTEREPWRAAGILFAVFLLVTPWFLPWYTVGLIALVASISFDPVLSGTLAFSGASLFTASRLVGPVAQALVRYGTPAGAYLSARRHRR